MPVALFHLNTVRSYHSVRDSCFTPTEPLYSNLAIQCDRHRRH